MSSALTVDDLRAQLGSLGLSTRGRRPELRSRLRKGRSRLSPTPYYSEDAGKLAQREEFEEEAEEEEWIPQYDSYLVLDVEATCERGNPARGRGASFDFPNEIIELPVVLLQWRPSRSSPIAPPTSPSALRRAASRGSNIDQATSPRNAKQQGPLHLEVIDTFHTYVKPEWRPRLTRFCRELTGIDQATVDAAPTFPVALNALRSFLSRHSLLQAPTGPRWRSASTARYRGTSPVPDSPSLASASSASALSTNAATSYADDVPAPALRAGVAWVTHTPHDLRDFIPKQCWISAMHTPPPFMLPAPLVDVRVAVPLVASLHVPPLPSGGGRGDTTIDGLLQMLRLEAFRGRRHSGLADTQNIARIVVECARRVVEAAQEHRKLCQPAQRQPPSSPRATGSSPRSVASRAQNDEALLRAERSKAFARTRSLEEGILPNTNLTKAAARKWHWMGHSLGEITWLDEEERDTEPEQEEDIFVYKRREDAYRSSARFSRGSAGGERLLWSSMRHSTSTSTMTSSSSGGSGAFSTTWSPVASARSGNGNGAVSPTSPIQHAHAHAAQANTPTRQTGRRGGGASGGEARRPAPTSPRNARLEYSYALPSPSPGSGSESGLGPSTSATEPSSSTGATYAPRSPYSARSYALHQQQHAQSTIPTSPASHAPYASPTSPATRAQRSQVQAHARRANARRAARHNAVAAAAAAAAAAVGIGTGTGASQDETGSPVSSRIAQREQEQSHSLYGSNGAW